MLGARFSHPQKLSRFVIGLLDAFTFPIPLSAYRGLTQPLPTWEPSQGDSINRIGEGTVVCARSDQQFSGSATQSILELAETAGLTPKFGCRRGLCHTCDRPLLSGQVVDRRTGQVLNRPGMLVQLCVTQVAGDAVLDL